MLKIEKSRYFGNGLNDRREMAQRKLALCQISCKTVTEISPFFDFQHGGRLPSWICCTFVLTTHEEHLMVFIAAQNPNAVDA